MLFRNRSFQDLSRHNGKKIMIPVVYTSTLGFQEEQSISEKAELVYGVSRTPQVWIDCQTIESGGCLIINWDVRDGIFDNDVINDMFAALLKGVKRLSDDENSWDDLELIRLLEYTQSERKNLNKTEAVIKDKYLYDGFLENAKKNPEEIALISEGVQYSYIELAKYVQSVRNALKQIGLNSGDKVAVIEDKGIMQIAAVLGIIIQGGIYVPIVFKMWVCLVNLQEA